MKIYISASWKNHLLVGKLAGILRVNNHEVFDFTDSSCRKTHATPLEMFPEQFDPLQHTYSKYNNREQWRSVVNENREAIKWADLIILLLPC